MWLAWRAKHTRNVHLHLLRFPIPPSHINQSRFMHQTNIHLSRLYPHVENNGFCLPEYSVLRSLICSWHLQTNLPLAAHILGGWRINKENPEFRSHTSKSCQAQILRGRTWKKINGQKSLGGGNGWTIFTWLWKYTWPEGAALKSLKFSWEFYLNSPSPSNDDEDIMQQIWSERGHKGLLMWRKFC